MPLLEVKNLTISFNNNKTSFAVNDISFSLERGETLGLVGESGSGKTLSGLALMRILPAGVKVTGNIQFHTNSEIIDFLSLTETDMRNYRGRTISMIFQEPMTALNPSVLCGRQVEEILRIHTSLTRNQRKNKVLELFEEVKFRDPGEYYSKYPHQLSGGQRQRVVIAMAIACNPEILIADEPTTALDVTTQKSIITLLEALKIKHNLSIIFITHDLRLVSGIADRILILSQGNIIESGFTKDVLINPVNDYTRALIACVPKQDVRQLRLPTIEDFKNSTTSKSGFNQIENGERKKMHQLIYSKPPILEVDHLNTFFRKKQGFLKTPEDLFHALKEIKFSLWKGETLGLVGESGSGKTTLGRTLMQLIENYEGNIRFNGIEVSKLKGKELTGFRKKVQLIFQDPYSSLNPNHTIGYIISEPILVHQPVNFLTQRKGNNSENNLSGISFSGKSEIKSRVMQLMEITGLKKEWFYRYPHQLSGGQRQRVAIARALALQPEILICDEIVASLDVSVQAQILNLLNDLKHNLGLTYIFISHDLVVVKYISDRILVMKDCRIVEQGETDEMCISPTEEYTKNLIDAAFKPY
jgi:peptide/nickel transport system ATP-binding protein